MTKTTMIRDLRALRFTGTLAALGFLILSVTLAGWVVGLTTLLAMLGVLLWCTASQAIDEMSGTP